MADAARNGLGRLLLVRHRKYRSLLALNRDEHDDEPVGLRLHLSVVGRPRIGASAMTIDNTMFTTLRNSNPTPSITLASTAQEKGTRWSVM
jgi:hypothetical protein